MITAFLAMKPMGKARPRFGKGRAFMPPKYMKWKREFITRLRLATGPQDPLVGTFALSIIVTRKSGKMKSDLDNVAGSILDALQDGSFIVNDRDCRSLNISMTKSKQEGITVALESIK